MDFRLIKGIKKYMEDMGLTGDCDLVSVAGAAKNISNPGDVFDTQFVLKQVGLSHDLHHIKKIILMNHLDCGAYGGARAFATPEEEHAKHVTDLKAAAEAIKQKYPDLLIAMVIAKFLDDGDLGFEEIA